MNPHASPPAIHVLMVDDNALFRKGIISILNAEQDLNVVGEAENGQTAVDLFHRQRPDAVVMDLNMPVMNGVEATRTICQRFPDAHILLCSVAESDGSILDAVRYGATGFVLKNAQPEHVMASIRQVSHGQPVISSGLAVQILHEFSCANGGSSETSLTHDEFNLLTAIAMGVDITSIASEHYTNDTNFNGILSGVLSKFRRLDLARPSHQ